MSRHHNDYRYYFIPVRPACPSPARSELFEGWRSRKLVEGYSPMILGVGVDSVEVHRFKEWHTFSRKKLSRIFSEQEIDYCLQQSNKSAERFAVRFAAREAFFKALSAAFPHVTIPFLTLCKQVCIEKQGGRPVLLFYNIYSQNFTTHLSLTHTDFIATAFVVIEKKSK